MPKEPNKTTGVAAPPRLKAPFHATRLKRADAWVHSVAQQLPGVPLGFGPCHGPTTALNQIWDHPTRNWDGNLACFMDVFETERSLKAPVLFWALLQNCHRGILGFGFLQTQEQFFISFVAYLLGWLWISYCWIKLHTSNASMQVEADAACTHLCPSAHLQVE